MQKPPPIYFLHIPKTGGTTFSRFLEDQYPVEQILPASVFPELRRLAGDPEAAVCRLLDFRLITKQHRNFLCAQRFREIRPETRIVTVLREPISRALSAINHWRRMAASGSAQIPPEKAAMVRDSLRLPVMDFMSTYKEFLSDRQAKFLAGIDKHDSGIDRDLLLEKALKHLDSVDFVGVTEQMQAFSSALSFHLGLSDSIGSELLNVNRDPSRLSNEERKQIEGMLAELNSVDMALYAEANVRCNRLIHAGNKIRRDLYHRPELRCLLSGERVWISMTSPLQGLGWHERERGIQSDCRWAGPDRVSSLFADYQVKGGVEVQCWMPSVICGDVLSGMDLRINGQQSSLEFSVEDGYQLVTARANVPEAQGCGLHLEFVFPSVKSAHEICGVPDRRLKTVAVERVAIRMLEEEMQPPPDGTDRSIPH